MPVMIRKEGLKSDFSEVMFMKVVLQRYHGLGNDYVVFDPNKNELELTPENVRVI